MTIFQIPSEGGKVYQKFLLDFFSCFSKMISLKLSIKFTANKQVSGKLEWKNQLCRMENMLKMINAQDVISKQGGAKCQKLISDRGGKSAIRVGQKIQNV